MTTITPRSAKDRPASLDLDRPRDPLDDLIRQLVRLVGGRAAADGARGENTREEIIIDTSVDGVRYLFIRMPPSAPSLVSLSPREHEIVRMVAKGYPNKTIAGILNISSWTVCTHLRRIFAKLGVASRAAMVARLLEEVHAFEPRPDERQPARADVDSDLMPRDRAGIAKVRQPERPDKPAGLISRAGGSVPDREVVTPARPR
jgi:DNA-binding CsgD family transcriptional regulator